MKKTLIFILICSSIFCNSGIVSAQVKTTYLPSFEILVNGKSLKAGLNLIYTSPSGCQTFANKITGKETEYLFKKSDGTPIASEDNIVMAKGKRTCWKCYTEPNGDVNCFERSCPKIIVSGPGKTL